MMKGFVVFLLLLLQCASCVQSARHPRIDRRLDGVVSPSGFIVEPTSQNWPRPDLNLSSSSGGCEETYGIFPCSDSAVGNLLLVVAYGYLMFVSGSFLMDGCELLLVVMGPGITGGLILPILGSFSHVAPILVSGFSGSKETAQAQVQIGMGLIAGSTVSLLTLLWGACLIFGKCDIAEESTASKDTRGFDLYGSGITTDEYTKKASRIMVLSVIPFLVVQLHTVIHSSSGKRIVVLAACITAIICLLSYSIYQVSDKKIQKRLIAYAKRTQYIISAILSFEHLTRWGTLFKEDGKLDDEGIRRIFETLDYDDDGHLTKDELRGLIVGLELQDPQPSSTSDEFINQIMENFDSSGDGKVSRDEFQSGMKSWHQMATSQVGRSWRLIAMSTVGRSWLRIASSIVARSKILTSNVISKTRDEHETLENNNDENNNDENVVEVDKPYRVYLMAVLLMLGGVILAGIFADPFVHAVDNFSDATSIPSFFISFIIMPLAANAGEAVRAINLASQKTKRLASLTYSEIYGVVTMNNTLCLGVFLAIIYIRGLDWDFSAEMLAILLVVLVMGLLSSFRTTFPLWMSFIAFLLYPLTLAMVYVLHYGRGWA